MLAEYMQGEATPVNPHDLNKRAPVQVGFQKATRGSDDKPR